VFGHDWQPAQAVIVIRHVKKTSSDGSIISYEYVADVTPADGATFRATVQEPGIASNFWPPSAGDQVSVLIDDKREKVKFDKDDPRLDAKATMSAQKDVFDSVRSSAPGSAIFGQGSLSPDSLRSAIQSAVDAAATGQHVPVVMMGQVGVTGGPGGRGGTVGSGGPDGAADRLARLDALHQQGVLTDAEYATARARIIAEL
jgi:hypothetical protein